ncbi:sporulation protein [Deinococcus puniceus]|uniref:Sporulation protein n=1 Tax=Deinococcus puniceus TaxID=1182568 RepID=A0A172T7R5_9DEIO|nr:sporulation protein [Deinococcus puniceus]ANE43020.1 sporulation protein [Deinococcus puniceus]
MGFLKKMMASVGVGAAKVDAQLRDRAVRIGDPLTGVVVVKGGAVEQTIERINLGIATRYRHDDSYVNHTLFTQPITGNFVIRPGETQEFPFSVVVPAGTPLTLPGTSVWLVTDADIAGASDPSDNDQLTILPSAGMETLISAAQRLGFSLAKSEVEYSHGRIAQELSFRPPHGQYKLTELELMMFPNGDGLDVILEVDRRATGVASLFTSEFESKDRWNVPGHLLRQGPDAVAHELEGRIKRMS